MPPEKEISDVLKCTFYHKMVEVASFLGLPILITYSMQNGSDQKLDWWEGLGTRLGERINSDMTSVFNMDTHILGML